MRTAAQWLFIISVPFLLLMASISGAVNSHWLYRYGFEKYDISQVTGLAPAELDKAADGLVRYFNSADEFISVTVVKDGRPFVLFNEREVTHLKDVKALFRLAYKVLFGTLVYVLVFTAVSLFWWRDRRRLGWGLVGGGGLTLVLMLALGLLVIFDFDQFFLAFHLLSFANDFWMLNPATDYLIMLFPDGFWYDVTAFCALAAAAGALVLGGIGWWLRRNPASEG